MRSFTEIMIAREVQSDKKRKTGYVTEIDFCGNSLEKVILQIEHGKDADLKHIRNFHFKFQCRSSVQLTICYMEDLEDQRKATVKSYQRFCHIGSQKVKQYDFDIPVEINPLQTIMLVIEKTHNIDLKTAFVLEDYSFN